MRLQRISFNHSDIPPSVRSAIVEPSLGPVVLKQRTPSSDLELRVFRAAKADRGRALDPVRGNEPAPSITYMDEEVVTA